MRRRFIYLGLAFSFLLLGVKGLTKLTYVLTGGFYEYRIMTDLPNREAWESQIPPPEGALTQTYHFLTYGGQSFVFESEDRQYVLKFFKYHPRKRYNPFRKKIKIEPFKEDTLLSALYALKYLQSETLVEYVHLNRGEDHLPAVTCIDRLGRRHVFDLNKYQFVIQRKGCTLEQRLTKRIKDRDMEGAKQDIRKCLDLFIACHHKGITNHDPYMTRNFGFVGERPIVIDSGCFSDYTGSNPHPLPEKELRKGVLKLLQWTDRHCPLLSQEIETYIREAC